MSTKEVFFVIAGWNGQTKPHKFVVVDPYDSMVTSMALGTLTSARKWSTREMAIRYLWAACDGLDLDPSDYTIARVTIVHSTTMEKQDNGSVIEQYFQEKVIVVEPYVVQHRYVLVPKNWTEDTLEVVEFDYNETQATQVDAIANIVEFASENPGQLPMVIELARNGSKWVYISTCK